jgi:hypothetical protein
MTESTDTLSQSLHDAELLTSYAGRFGVAIEHNVLNVVTRARELFKQGLLHGEAEAEFYQNFIALSKAVYPVTVESLRSCMIERKFRNWVFWQCDPRTPAHRILEVHRAWGFIALITLMVVQTYWVVGSFLTASIPILSDDPSVFLPAMQERAIWTVTDSTKAATEESGTPSPATTEKAKDPGSVETNPPTKQDDHDADPNAKVATSKISSELETMKRAKLDTYKGLLDIWASPGVGIAKLSNWVLKPEHRGTDESQGWLSGTVAKEALIIVQTYVLPPLYGWVGAMAYVLRRLISEINARTYQETSNTSYNLRIYLGVLAGLAIGWFLAPDTKANGNVLHLLSPLALAFLAGYSVELLFSAMDKLLEAFSAKSPGSKSS